MAPGDTEWRWIPGYEGLYEVSSNGAIRSVDRVVTSKAGVDRPVRGVPLKLTRNPAHGYLACTLSRDGRQKYAKVHVIVACAFLGERPNGALVRHLDGDQLNNTPGNLTYGTTTENNRDTVTHGRHKESRKTHCVREHEFSESNTGHGIQKKNGRPYRWCRQCAREKMRSKR